MAQGPQHYTNKGSSAAFVISALGGRSLISFVADNENASARWFQFFDQTTTPQNNDVPKLQFLCPAGQQIGRGTDVFTEKGLPFVNGLAWAFSTSKDVLTLGTATEQTIDVFYV